MSKPIKIPDTVDNKLQTDILWRIGNWLWNDEEESNWHNIGTIMIDGINGSVKDLKYRIFKKGPGWEEIATFSSLGQMIDFMLTTKEATGKMKKVDYGVYLRGED